jgi:hypothetical protein
MRAMVAGKRGEGGGRWRGHGSDRGGEERYRATELTFFLKKERIMVSQLIQRISK